MGGAALHFAYTSPSGSTSNHTATPLYLRFGFSDASDTPQWIIRAHDHDADKEMDFDLVGMYFYHPKSIETTHE